MARVLRPEGSLFLNVGAKPTDPWTAIDVAQAVRPHLRLQNTIHWIKSIAIEKSLAGARADLEDDLAVGHYKPINSRRFLHDCHEFVFHFTAVGRHAARSAGRRRSLSGPVERRPLADRRVRRPLSRQHLVHPLRDDSEPRKGPAASGDLPAQAPGDVPAAARPRPRPGRRRSVPRPRLDRRRLRRAGRELRRHRDGRGLPRSGDRANARGASAAGRACPGEISAPSAKRIGTIEPMRAANVC